ncbi:helix-turn-helix domain-containing protein [Nocardioides sp. CN2-186]|uniref:TetR/AcrR family transcriptional regulator n=1 Tax=Nocardioides tweenelious TaxID=3156607 RepID=UPI0032B51CB2
MVTREAALDSAQRQLNHDPFKSMAELAEGMGIARATLHRHFETRDQLFRELVERAVLRWRKCLDDVDAQSATESDDPDLVAKCIRRLFQGYMAQPEDFGLTIFHHVLDRDPKLRRLEREIARREEVLLRNAQRLDLLRSELPALWLSSTLWGLGIGARYALSAGDAAPNILPALVWTTFLDGAGSSTHAHVWHAQRPLRY